MKNIWLSQKMMAALYDVSVPAINQHLKKIFEDGELLEESTIKKYLIVQQEGSRQVSRWVDHYNLQAIKAEIENKLITTVYDEISNICIDLGNRKAKNPEDYVVVEYFAAA